MKTPCGVPPPHPQELHFCSEDGARDGYVLRRGVCYNLFRFHGPPNNLFQDGQVRVTKLFCACCLPQQPQNEIVTNPGRTRDSRMQAWKLPKRPQAPRRSQAIPSDPKRSPAIPGDPRRSPAIPGDTKRSQANPTQRPQAIPQAIPGSGDPKPSQAMRRDPKPSQAIPRAPKRSQAIPSDPKRAQAIPSETRRNPGRTRDS